MTSLNDGDQQSPSTSQSDSDAIATECQELQETEVEVLLSIYTSSLVVHRPPLLDIHQLRMIMVTIQIDLCSPARLKCCHPALPAFPDPLQPSESALEQPESLELRFLPPITLIATLPPTYPLRLPPSLQLDCDWATPSDHLRAMDFLARSWKYGVPETDTVTDGDQCLSLCVDWLEHDWFNSAHPPDIALQYSTPEQQRQTIDRVINYDRNRRAESFKNEDFECGICLECQKGSQCLRLASCGHVFCHSCLKDFFSLMICDGNVQQVACCDQSCVKARTEDHATTSVASPGKLSDGELEGIVGPALKERYDKLVEKQLIESDPMLCNCPMKFCHALVRPDPTLAGTRSENLRVCESCGFAFCFKCKKTWHGAVNKCAVSYAEAISKEWLSASWKAKFELETRIGRTRLQRLVKEYLEDHANERWKRSHTTPCVKCTIPVEKASGCNHMVCPRCKTHFCFACGAYLNPESPYAHYSQRESPCYNQLVEVVRDVEVEQDMRFDELLALQLAYD